MEITQQVRDYAREQGVGDEDALSSGMDEKSREFVDGGADVYRAP